MTAHIEVLKKAREKIEAGWVQGAFAKRADGTTTFSTDKEATCFCIVGAVRNASIELASIYHPHAGFAGEIRAVGLLADVVLNNGKPFVGNATATVECFNDQDDTSHMDVLVAMDFAILMAEDEAA